MVAFISTEFSFCVRWAELSIFVNKNGKKTSTVFCFCLTKQKRSTVLILLALQNYLTGSLLTNKGTFGAGIRELKPGVAALQVFTTIALTNIVALRIQFILNFALTSVLEPRVSIELSSLEFT